jgi:hypothetical protein
MRDQYAEIYAINQPSHHILNEGNDDGRQRLLRAQKL